MDIDWSKVSVATLGCRCGTEFRGKAKARFDPPKGIVSEHPCPGCGKTTDLTSIRMDPETLEIR